MTIRYKDTAWKNSCFKNRCFWTFSLNSAISGGRIWPKLSTGTATHQDLSYEETAWKSSCFEKPAVFAHFSQILPKKTMTMSWIGMKINAKITIDYIHNLTLYGLDITRNTVNPCLYHPIWSGRSSILIIRLYKTCKEKKPLEGAGVKTCLLYLHQLCSESCSSWVGIKHPWNQVLYPDQS